MPLTVITLSKVKNSLKGDLTKWMQEIDTGVYIGNFNSKVRENLWQRIKENIDDGSATMSFAYRNEIGYDFKTINTDRDIVYFDDIPLVMNKIELKEEKKTKHGFSRQANIRKAQKFMKNKKSINYVVVDIETSGLDCKKSKIIEIGAVLTNTRGDILDKFQCMIKQDIKLDKNIVELTGITDMDLSKGKDEREVLKSFLEFIKDYPLLGYNFNFDMSFLNNSLERNSLKEINNKSYDLKYFVKLEKFFMKNYKLETALKEYGIDKKVKHRALEDAIMTQELSIKVNEFLKKL